MGYRVSSVVMGETHVYEEELTASENKVAPRCKPSTTVKKSNTKSVSESEFEDKIREGVVCPHCLRYKGDIILKEE